MSSVATDNKQFIDGYIKALSGKKKTDAMVDEFVSDPVLKEHIRECEAAFPGYEIEVQAIVSDGDLVAVRGEFRGTHRGAFAGVEATGKAVAAGVMLFYRLVDGRIAEFWMQFDMMGLMNQLTAR